MSLVLIACTPEEAVSLQRILQGHELVIADRMKGALNELRNLTFDLIIIGLHFDQSGMFEFMREVKSNSENGNSPIICYCARETEMTGLMHESLQFTIRALGAWMYLNEHAYNVYKDPDEELRRVIERCLTGEARKRIQQERRNIQQQRELLHKLRVLLQAQKRSPELKEYLRQLRSELSLLLDRVTELQSCADGLRSNVESSRDLKDRVSEHVTIDENGMAMIEEIQSLDEARQLTHEKELVEKEMVWTKEGQRWLVGRRLGEQSKSQ